MADKDEDEVERMSQPERDALVKEAVKEAAEIARRTVHIASGEGVEVTGGDGVFIVSLKK